MLKWFFLILVCADSSYCSFLEWLGFQEDPIKTVNRLTLIKVPFEELDPEEKFIVEASKITGLKLDELNVCQQKLVLKLKTSCGELSDEELSKLSVGLLNCQSEIEGRKVFPCTPEMSLRQCTRDMDNEIWNTYHVISNRARAVCYAVRQDQFRALAEMTVNKLMTITQDHINNMALVEEKQVKLGQSTQAVLNQLQLSHTNVLASYTNLKKMENTLVTTLAYGVYKMEHQKQLLLNVQEIITALMHQLQSEVESTSNQVSDQMKQSTNQHQILERNLKQLNKTSEQIAKKLNESNYLLTKSENEILAKTEEAISRLNNINMSITNLAVWVEFLEEISLPRLKWLKEFIGEKGDRLDLMILVCEHVISLLLVMLICSFVAVPLTSKWFLCIAATLNMYLSTSVAYQQFSTSLFNFYVGFLAIVLGDYLSRLLYNYYTQHKTIKASATSNHNWKADRMKYLNSSPEKSNKFAKEETEVNGDIHFKVNSWLSGRSTGERNGHLLSTRTPFKTLEEDRELNNFDINNIKKDFFVKRQGGGSSIGGSSSIRSKCSAICKSGVPCKNPAVENGKCRVHGPRSSETR